MDASGGARAIPSRLEAVDAVLESFFRLAASRAGRIGDAYTGLWSALETSARGGKRLRPRLVLATYSGFGGSELGTAAHVGAAFELLHTALIVHDDVIDRDFTRRGSPNVSGRYRDVATTAGIPIPTAEHRGMSTAVIAGDLALAGAYRLLDRAGMASEQRERMAELLDEAVFASAAGELIDVDFSIAREIPSVEAVVEMERLKTAVYTFEAPLQAGAVLAGADDAYLPVLAEFGRDIGTAYQATDDLLGVFGDERETGKTTVGDLREGKRTVPIAYAATTGAWPGIRDFLGKADLTDGEAAEVRARLIACGAEVYTRNLASRMAGDAVRALDRLPAPVAEELAPLAGQALDRIR
ncbi:polyprenyl synthetase family protein [Naasia aerilata]|uniref:Geranylgeranyl pyrophosphate synthase n=1 Tax=Naasia aerilata TaxID=1162966 RepID=A0ABM8GAS7_9MICO|nr:polyprenyl synthetase family protein [Naasia aerilata]BDZ45324.1 geranylgeranyl pyrophosphate synthase [Naasia aerilata]